MGFSHIGFCVPHHKFDETVAFYLSALAPLGYKEHMRPVDNVVGLGVYYPDFWITGVKDGEAEAEGQGEEDATAAQTNRKPIHIAFSANSKSPHTRARPVQFVS